MQILHSVKRTKTSINSSTAAMLIEVPDTPTGLANKHFEVLAKSVIQV